MEHITSFDHTPALATQATIVRLLKGGIAAGPILTLVSFAQAAVRRGFDLKRYPISFLSLGHLGWIQICNFIITGVLVLAAAIGMRRTLFGIRGGTWGPRLVGIFGFTLITAGIFSADPAFGFPPGTPEGIPVTMSWHGSLHALSFSLGMVSFISACFVFARRFAVEKQKGWMTYCLVSGVVVPVLIAVGSTNLDIQGLPMAAVVVILSAWISAISMHTKSALMKQM